MKTRNFAVHLLAACVGLIATRGTPAKAATSTVPTVQATNVVTATQAQNAVPTVRTTNTAAPAALSTTSAAPQAINASPAPPPATPAKRSKAELEKLVAPIALHPDPLIAILLPASVYPIEIVQAARFVKDTNNIPKVDEQPWDENVKAAAKVPALIAMMDQDLEWTIQLGQAFLDEPKELMDMIQTLRNTASKAGTLQTTSQQVVVVTNEVVKTTVEQQVVVVTNTVVQIQPSNPQVVYVPSYPPTVYYPPPGYVYDPVAPLVTFGVGMAMGAIIANNCDWHGGGVYVGHHGVAVWGGGGYHGDVDIDVNRNTTINQGGTTINRGGRPTPYSGGTGATATQQKWKPDQNRMRTSGAGSASASTMEARGWSGGGARPSTQPAVGTRPATPSTGAVGARPATGAAGTRPSTGTVGARPSTGVPAANRPVASPNVSRPSPSPSVSRPAASPTPTVNRSSGGSAFSGMNSGAATRSYSNRGAASRSGGGGAGGGGFRGGGGGRGGGGRGR